MNRKLSRLRGLAALASGMLFGAGLAVAHMTNPDKVLNFLDIADTWDVSLLLVLGAATGTYALAFHAIRKRGKPLLDAQFHLPALQGIDRRLVLGSAVFGVGWGLAGYCPGPAIASLAFGNPEALWVVPSIVAGIALQRWMKR